MQQKDRTDKILGAAYRNSDFHRLQCLRITAPAAIIGFLEYERLFDSQAVRHRKNIPVSRRRLRLTGSYVPARTGAARSDRAAGAKWREHDHFHGGRYRGVFLSRLAADLKNATHGQEIFTRIGRMNLRDTQVDGVNIG